MMDNGDETNIKTNAHQLVRSLGWSPPGVGGGRHNSIEQWMDVTHLGCLSWVWIW